MAVVERDELQRIVTKLDKTIVTTNGAFDLFHAGHLSSLRFAKGQGDVLIVGINSDASIKKYKSEKRPIIPQDQRAEIVAAIDVVDYVVIFEEKDPRALLETIRPDVHVKGDEYENIIERDVVEKHGGKVVFMKRTDISTSNIINTILKRYR